MKTVGTRVMHSFCPEHPNRDQNPKTPLSESMSIPVSFIWDHPPLPGIVSFVLVIQNYIIGIGGIMDRQRG